MASRIARHLTAAAVGATLALSLTACASDPVDAYLADIKAASAGAGQETPTDGQALLAGGIVCGMSGDPAFAEAAKSAPLSEVIQKHCGIFPLTEEQRARYGLGGMPGAAAPTTVAAAPTGPELSPRGAIPKMVGEKAGVHGDDGADSIAFTVTKVEVDPTCNAVDVYEKDAVPVPGGHFVALTIDVETGPGYTSSDYPFGAASYVGSDGYTVDSGSGSWPAYLCAGDKDRLTSAMGPGSKYRGLMMLNVPSTPGIVVLSTSQGDKWEYGIPAA